MAAFSKYPGVAQFAPTLLGLAAHLRDVVAGLLIGKLNVCVDVTLTANAASTTVTDARIRESSGLYLMPTTANAAAALGTTYISDSGRTHGSVTITHANNAQTDRTFRVAILG